MNDRKKFLKTKIRNINTKNRKTCRTMYNLENVIKMLNFNFGNNIILNGKYRTF